MPRTLSYVTKYGRSCDGCGAVLAATSRPYRRFCSGACRAAAHRREHDTRLVTPGELARLVRAVDPAAAEVSLVTGSRSRPVRTGAARRGCWNGVGRNGGPIGCAGRAPRRLQATRSEHMALAGGRSSRLTATPQRTARTARRVAGAGPKNWAAFRATTAFRRGSGIPLRRSRLPASRSRSGPSPTPTPGHRSRVGRRCPRSEPSIHRGCTCP